MVIANIFISYARRINISPIGLAAISNLSPKRYVGQMMGIWFLASSLGAIIAGLLSGQATYEA